MQFLQKHHSKFTRVVMFGLLILITCVQAMAQKPTLPAVPITCDYTTAPANITLTVGAEPIGFSKNYLLVNMVSGAIIATNPTAPSFTSIPQGLYYATTAYYTSGATIHNDIVGKLISEVYVDGLVGGCLKYATTVGIKVCTATCDFNTAPAAIAFTATPSSTSGVSTTYALVDEATNKIIQTSTGASFTAVPVGDFSVVGVYYTGAFALAVGDTLYAKTTNDVNCVGVSNTIHYKVCSTVCLAGTTAPIIPVTAINTCPVTTVNFTGLDTGAKPAGTTLVWSTHKLPTSASDTLTNLTTLSTAGKYYALYFDKVNSCYSPADSVDVTITTCLPPCLAGTTAPSITPTTATNTCPTTTVSLAGLANTGTKPAGTTLIWSTHKVPTSAGDTLTNLTTVSTSGKYYALYFDKVNNCYSPADSVDLTISVCLPPIAATNPPAQTAVINTPKTGTASTDLTPSGGNGTYVYSVDNTASCIIPSGGTALPSGSNLTVTNSTTGAYTYTAPATAGIYYYCIKVCDTSTPTPNCITKTYTLTVTSLPLPITATNTCPISTVNLMTHVDSTNKPAGTVVSWHSGTPATLLNKVLNPTTVGTSGTYYVCYENVGASCFGGTGAGVSVIITPCLPTCVAGTTAPAITPTTATNTCPITTVSLAGLANTGTKPVGTTLIWSTHKVPTSAGDTLTNLTTVSTAGKYYALYFDKVNNCYSPADSVVITIITCCVAGTIAPIITAAPPTNNCPTNTVNLAALINTGTKPVGTTLIWSTHKVPTSAGDTLTNLTTVSTAGKYYALYFDKVNNCYSPADSVVVTITPCSPSANSDNLTATVGVPTILSVLTNDKNPDGTPVTDLTKITLPTVPSTGTGAPTKGTVLVNSDGTITYTPTAGSSGTDTFIYTICDKVNTAVCDTSLVTITINAAPCLAGTTAPSITPTTATNTCPTITVSLSALANTGTKPAGTTLVWSTHKVPTSAGDTLTNLTTISTAGKYYALYFDKVNICYSPADSVVVTITVCLAPIAATNPPAQTAVVNTPKTGTASTDLSPSGGNGTYVYSVDNTASCIIPSGGTTLPSGSNLTVTNSTTGAYTYTAPATAGIYYYCIKVCDTSTPTPQCITKTYTLTVTNPTQLSNTCPSLTVDLMVHVDSTTKPAGTIVSWHTGTPATLLNKVLNPTAVATSGTYYVCYQDVLGACFGTTTGALTVTIIPCATPCLAGTTAPIITPITATNTCPTTTVSLASLPNTGTKPAGTTLIWSTHKIPISAGDTLSNLTTVATSGKYYALYFDKVNNCYSPADSVVVTITTCTTPLVASNPPPQNATVNEPKTGKASTDLSPSGGNGTYTYSIDNSAACVAPSGATALPSGSNLTVTNSSTGDYTYTAPATAGVYYYCIKVCDTSTPNAQCLTKTYTLTVSDANNIFNACPATTVNLMAHIDSTNKPANSYVTWHTASPATATNQVSDPTSVAVSGTYYAAYYETTVGCYGASTSPVTVTINPCPPTIITNTCPAVTVNLMSHIDSTNKPAGAIVTWHTGKPATVANRVSDPTVATAGTYYGAYYSPSSDCYGLETSPITVNIVACPAVCTPPFAPVLAGTTKANVCPSATADITTLQPTAVSGTTLEWHTVATNPTAGDLVTNPTTVGAGTYYLYAVASSPANCYSPASQGAVVTITVCCTAPAAPVLSSTAAQSNTCPSTTVDLTSIQPSAASGTTLEWHSVASNPTAANLVTMPVTASGTYYLYAKASSPANCFSPASAGVPVTIVACTACPNTLAVVKPTSPSTCGGTDGSITFSGLMASTTYTFNYEKDGGAVQSATGTADGTGKLTILGLGMGVYTNIHAASPCVSNAVKTTIFAPSICIAPIVTPQDSTVKVCTPLATLGSLSATATTCPGYPKIAGATATATIESGQLCITYKPKPGFTGVDSVCVTLCDATTSTCTTIKVPVTIKPVPLAINDINLTLVNVPVSGSVATNDVKTALTDVFTVTTTPNNGTIVFNPDGTYTYTPTTDFVGKDSVNYKICSIDNLCTTATLYLNVYKPDITKNLPPIAQNDVAQTNMNIPVSGNLASNDFDPENGTLKYTLTPVSNPTNGTVSINANGSYTYTPNAGFIGMDIFEYQVCDDLNQCTTAKAVVYIRPDANGITTNDAPNAQDDSYRTSMNVPVTGNVRLNDSDPNGNTLTTTVTSPTTHGTFALAANGAFTYTPTLGYFGTDQLKYKACDAAGLCDTATVYIVVVPPVPDAQLDVNITTKNNPVSGNILTNDNGGGLPFTLTPFPLTDPSHGAIVLNVNGSYIYTPVTGFVGKDSIQYVICNTASLCDTTWLTINVIDPIRFVNNAPIASDDAGQTLKNVPVTGKVTNNDIDPDGDILSASVIVQPDNGTVTLNTDGTYTYTPDPNFTGRDKFQYKVCDAQGACDTAIVVITVVPDYNGTTNDRPNAQDDAALTNLNIPVSGTLKSNDTDPNGNVLTYTTTPITPPAHGVVTITATGNYNYTPATGFFGTDQFKYKVCDNGSPTLCDTATVYVVVLAPTPDAQNDINVTLKNKSVTGNTATNDAGNGLPFTTNPMLVKTPIYGNLTIATNGTYTYTPATGFVGKDSAQYVICNAASRCDSAWIIVTILPNSFINGNNPPIAISDVAQTLKNVPVSGKVTNNDLEPDGDPLTATLTKSPVNGTLVFNPDGTFTYTPNANFVGKDVFCYKICDPSNACDSACVAITVNPDINGVANDKPNAQDDAAITAINTAVTGQLKPNDSDPNVGQTLTYSSTPVIAPTNGTVTINPTTGQFVYTPTLGYSGTDKFLYKVCDNGTPSLCDTATVFLTVIPPVINNPNAINDINVTFKNTPVSGNVLTNDDKAGQVVTTSLVTATPPKNGTITLLPNGNYTYVPNANFVGKDSTKYVLCNTVSLCDTAWIYLNVLLYPPSTVDNNKPVASNDVSVTYLNKPVNGSVGNNDFDPDITQTLTYTNLTDPNDGILVFNPDGTYTYTPVTDFTGIDMFTYKVCDNGTPVKCDVATVTIEVKPKSAATNDKPIANDDAFVTYKGVGVNGNTAPNDSDPNGNTLAFSKLTNPANGTVIMNANGTFSYAPNATFIGTDSFTYKICDNGTPVLCDTATVYLTVLPPKQPDANKPDAVNDIAMTIKNTPVSGNVLTNDDSKGNPLVAGLPSGTAPKHGIIALNPDGSFIYTPTTGYVGKDSVKYVICVNEIPMVRCDTAYIYFNVSDVPSPQNDKPIANNDVAKTEAGIPVKGNVLGNDVDPDLGDVLVATKLTNPANGTVTVNPDGSYIYTPATGFVGKDYFTYKVCDNGNPVKCDSAKVEIDVTPVITPTNANNKPTAQDDALLTKINTPKSGTVSLNDTDPDAGQTLVFSQLSNPAHGTITGFNPTTGAYTFTPTAGFVGNDSFKYKICDNGTPVLCDSATVIIIIETDDKITSPVAQNDIAITSPNTPVKGNVLTNDDSKGSPLMASLLTNPKNGTIVLNPDGSYTYTPNPNYVGRDSVKYKVCNALIPVQCDSAWLYINTIPYPTAGNDKPVAMPDNVVTQKGSPVSSSVLSNDYDPDLGQILTTSKVSDPANGTVTVNANGTYTYTPNPAFVGTDVFKYKICDNGSPSLCDTTSVTIKVLAPDPTLPTTVNLKPDAGDDVVVSTGRQPVTTSVIGNDRDPNAGQTLTYTLLNQPTKGTVTLSPTGTLVWTPGIDPALPYATYTVKYKVCDNGSPVLCDTATVELRTQPSMTQPDAQDDIAVVRVNTPITGNVLTNDDKKGLPVSPSVITPAKNGVFALNPDGSYTYTPNPNFVGADSVKYKICNNAVPVECDSAWVTFKVIPDPATGVNDKPVALNDVTQTNAGTPVSGNASTNDFDPDSGQTLTFTKLTNPTNGTATMNPNGTFTYTPNGGFTGTDVFKYKVCDNGTPVLCDTAKVIITVEPVTNNPAVNQPPVAIDDAILGIVGKPVTYNVGGNDKDPEGTPLAFTKLGGNPNVTIDALGNVTYTPAIDPLTGKPIGGNTVTYKVCDAGTPVKCDTATIYLTVSPSSTQPLAVNDINNTLINTTVTGDVLTNDDKKGLPVVVSQLTTAKHGSLTISANGTYGYIPTTGFVGKDSVQYQICNNEVPAECSKAWLFINVAPLPNTANDKPIASADAAQTLVNVPVSGKVTNNDTDPEGGVLTATKLTNPTNGTLVFNPDGTFTYTPNSGFIGKDKFTYKVCDTGSPVLCDTASVTIDVTPKLSPVGGNDSPNAQDDAIITNIGTPKTATVAPNDSDPNTGQTLSFTKVSNPLHGTVTVNADGSYTYTPTAGYTGPDKFTYKACDNGLPSLCDTATVYVNVLPLPLPTATTPVAINDINIVPKNTPVTGNVLTNDDKKGLPVTTSLITPATNGTFALNPNGTYTYTPTTGFVGKDSVQYQVCNNKVPAECDVAYVYLYVQDAPKASPTNNKPTAMADVNQTPVNLPVSGTVASNDFDPDLGQTLAFTKLTNPTNGTAVLNTNGTYIYTPATGFVGTDVFKYKVCDNQTPTLCDTTTVTIKVTPDYSGGGNIKPVANDDAFTTNKGVGINKNASLNDNDPNAGQTLSYSLLTLAANGTVSFNPDGTFAYTPNAIFVGTDKFLYKVCDNGTPSLCDTATVYVSVKEPLVNVCVNFDLKVLLEGPLNTVSGLMSNFLNVRGLLPGQTPVGNTATPTPNGQPYSSAPWNYAGTEAMPAGGYAADIVDWVLVSLRTDSLTTTPTFRAAGLLHENGSITFVNPCFTIANGSYYVLVEHRNHMGVMSDKKITVTSGTIIYDFTNKDSYALTNPPSYGQKLKGTKYVMYAADHKKALQNDNFDINAADSNLWKLQSGIFDRYLSGDYNFDADVNNSDNTLWKVNNGRFSGVAH